MQLLDVGTRKGQWRCLEPNLVVAYPAHLSDARAARPIWSFLSFCPQPPSSNLVRQAGRLGRQRAHIWNLGSSEMGPLRHCLASLVLPIIKTLVLRILNKIVEFPFLFAKQYRVLRKLVKFWLKSTEVLILSTHCHGEACLQMYSPLPYCLLCLIF